MAAVAFQPIPSTSKTTQECFEAFNAELIAYQDTRERIVKVSRDCTALSKRLIFHLHRIAGPNSAVPQKLFREAHSKEEEILKLFRQISVEVQDENKWRHQRALSPGLEEYIEALSFLHYLEHHSVITLEQVRQRLAPCNVHVTEEDYLCGLGDLTGELMRLGINSVGAQLSHQGSSVMEAEEAIRAIQRGCQPLVPHTRLLHKKMGVMDQSLRKLENASYTLALRGAEYAAFPEALKELVSRMQERPASAMDEDP